jgi:hypothetical protein
LNRGRRKLVQEISRAVGEQLKKKRTRKNKQEGKRRREEKKGRGGIRGKRG